MKTTIKLFTLTVMITLFFSVITVMAQMDFSSDDEFYINDIPFNTEIIAQETQFDRNIGFAPEEEEYIDDIPFDTHTVVYDICCDIELKQNYSFQDESYIDDIPFDTAEIFQQLISTNKTNLTIQEQNTHCRVTQEETETYSL